MRLLLAMGTAYLASGLVSFGQVATTPPRAHSAQSYQIEETPYLGVGGQDITSDRAKTLKLKEERGVEVTSVEPDSAAAKAGVKVGDVILQFNGQKVEGWEHLKRLVRETPVHREVKIVLSRNGAEQTVAASIGERKQFSIESGDGAWSLVVPPTPPMPPAAPMPPSYSWPSIPQLEMPQIFTLMPSSSLGIIGEALGQESQLAEFFGVKEGVLVRSVNKDSAAEKSGMKAGDVITRIDDREISTPQQISGALRAARGKSSVTVTVIRNKKETTLTVTPDVNNYYRGGIWDPKDNILLELFQPGQWWQKDKQ